MVMQVDKFIYQAHAKTDLARTRIVCMNDV